MKMEISIATPRDGSVAAVHVAAGDQVERGAILIELAEDGASAVDRPGDGETQTVAPGSVTTEDADA
jgi:pyruvate/2-oxoglutarate dehydrogenase complex dihydrolipoamide acyltransferase (E2) component